jgi:predicted dienelactone hydrolase
MRPFEWLVVLSFVPALLIPLVPPPWRPRWLLATVLLPVLAIVAHLAAEGWRTQMLPFYALSALVLASQLPALIRRKGAIRRRRDLLASSAIGLIVVLGVVFAGWLLPVIRLPEPTGPYQVGIVDRELVDKTRSRRLMVSVWYPAAQRGKPALLTQHPDALMAGLANLTSLPAPLFQHLRYVTLAASEGVPVLANSQPFPVLVFSHGLVGMRLQNSSTMQELASWGYVVVAIDHTDAAAVTVFPDGEERFYNLERFGIPAGVEPDKALVDERVFPVWVADQRFVYDSLETWAVHDPLLAGKLDLKRIGSFGHSFGGATALEVCRVDPRCRAAVNMDGALYGGSVSLPAVRPLLLMTSADSDRLSKTVGEWAHMIAQAGAAAYWMQLPNSTHLSFTFSELLSPLLVPKGFEPRAGLHIVDKYLRAFFDLHLRGMDTRVLGPASGETDVRWRTR